MVPPTPSVMEEAKISRPTALALALVFLPILLVPSVHQLVFELGHSGRWRFGALFQERPSHESLKRFEGTLERESALAMRVRSWYQSLLTCRLGLGNEKIVVGREGFLFFRKEVDMVSGPGFLSRRVRSRRGSSEPGENRKNTDIVGAIAHYDRELRRRGIHLVFVPVPLKTFIYPERVWPGYPLDQGPAGNRDQDAFLASLNSAGVDVLDLTPALWKAKSGGDVFLRLDTHWTPQGLAVAADLLAAHVRAFAGPSVLSVTPQLRTVAHDGDLLRMIDLPPEEACFPLQSVEIEQWPLRCGDEAQVLLLGDSFTNVYSRRELEWGEGAGLGEQLMRRLGVPVQILALNGGGATSVRELLYQKPSALREKKVVIWACSARDLFDEAVSWDEVPLPEPRG